MWLPNTHAHPQLTHKHVRTHMYTQMHIRDTCAHTVTHTHSLIIDTSTHTHTQTFTGVLCNKLQAGHMGLNEMTCMRSWGGVSTAW